MADSSSMYTIYNIKYLKKTLMITITTSNQIITRLPFNQRQNIHEQDTQTQM